MIKNVKQQVDTSRPYFQDLRKNMVRNPQEYNFEKAGKDTFGNNKDQVENLRLDIQGTKDTDM